jgi:hypothetical protein
MARDFTGQDQRVNVVSGARKFSSKSDTFLVGFQSVDYVVAISTTSIQQKRRGVSKTGGNFIVGVGGTKTVSEEFAYYEYTLDTDLTPERNYVFNLGDDYGGCCGSSGNALDCLPLSILYTIQLGGGADNSHSVRRLPFPCLKPCGEG